MSPRYVFSLQGVSKVYRTGMLLTYALQPVDLNVAEGDFVAVMGPSGSGKTTLLSILGLLETPTSGRLVVCDEDVGTWGDGKRSHVRGERIGFVFQSFNLIPTLSIIENVELPLLYKRVSRSRELAQEALARVGLQGRTAHMLHQLSGGQQQRAAIARAIADSPKVILADEPTGNLDTESARGVMEILSEVNAGGTTIVMVTHDRDCSRFAQRILQIVDGVLHETSNVQTLTENETGGRLCTGTT